MNGIVIEFLANNWVAQSNNTFTNTVEYEGFTSDEILEVDLYDDGTLTETQITEYDEYITEFNVEDGKIIAVATTKPTQSIKILARGEIVGKMIVNDGGSSNVSASDISCLDKDGQTSNIQKELDEQNKNLTWKTLGSVTSNNVINLPESFSEIKADVLGKSYSYSFNFILEQLNPSSERSYIDGYGTVNSNGQALSSYCILKISRTKAYIIAYMEDSAQYIPTLTIFYR